jgi:serine/threonine protein phosphatase PrpC
MVPYGPTGMGKINQDRGCIAWPFNGSYSEALLAIFDGHGEHGEKVSEMCVTELARALEDDSASLAAEPLACLKRNVAAHDKTRSLHPRAHPHTRHLPFAFSQVLLLDDALLEPPEIEEYVIESGSTVTIVYARGDELWVAWCGDSRCALGTRVKGEIQARALTFDHKPDLPDEQARVKKVGGKIWTDGKGRWRVAPEFYEDGEGLAMTRALGDKECKELAGVSGTPSLTHVRLNPAVDGGDGDVCLIVATDGLWDFVSEEEAAIMAMSPTYSSAQEASVALVHEAQSRWRGRHPHLRDDITVTVAPPVSSHTPPSQPLNRPTWPQVAYLPFLEPSDEPVLEGAATANGDPAAAPAAAAVAMAEEVMKRKSSAEKLRRSSTTERTSFMQMINMQEGGIEPVYDGTRASAEEVRLHPSSQPSPPPAVHPTPIATDEHSVCADRRFRRTELLPRPSKEGGGGGLRCPRSTRSPARARSCACPGARPGARPGAGVLMAEKLTTKVRLQDFVVHARRHAARGISKM